MTHIIVMRAKLIFFKVVFCLFSLMKQLFLEKIFSRTCTFRGKNDVQLTFDDSYISYESKIDVFLSSFLLVFLVKEQLFLKKFSSRTCTLRRKKLCKFKL